MIKQKITVLAAGLLLITAAGFCLLRSKRIAGKAVKGDALPAKDSTVYNPITLAAFKTAEQLKRRYDHVAWFDHVNKKTYFYVANGNMDYLDLPWNDGKNKVTGFKIGLVSPALKELIPPQYDLIHNISGTVDDLVEVEKGGKKGFYDLQGRNIVPVVYDALYPLNDDQNLALLLKGSDYYYLSKKFTISPKVAGLKIIDLLPKIKNYGKSYILSDSTSTSVMEYNVRGANVSVLIPPSYLVDWEVLPKCIEFRNPLRQPHVTDDLFIKGYYAVYFDGQKNKADNWFMAAFNFIANDWLNSRSRIYQYKNLLVIDKKENRIFGYRTEEVLDRLKNYPCDENELRAINDSLLEYKTTVVVWPPPFNDQLIFIAPKYTYLKINNGKLFALANQRIFGFTKYVKLNDYYLNGCYMPDMKTKNHLNLEMLEYAKNEIYASYLFRFKDTKLNKTFENAFGRGEHKLNDNVDDSLTAIDKYNINWINKKLMAKKPAN